jgi:hypothetical protein
VKVLLLVLVGALAVGCGGQGHSVPGLQRYDALTSPLRSLTATNIRLTLEAQNMQGNMDASNFGGTEWQASRLRTDSATLTKQAKLLSSRMSLLKQEAGTRLAPFFGLLLNALNNEAREGIQLDKAGALASSDPFLTDPRDAAGLSRVYQKAQRDSQAAAGLSRKATALQKAHPNWFRYTKVGRSSEAKRR